MMDGGGLMCGGRVKAQSPTLVSTVTNSADDMSVGCLGMAVSLARKLELNYEVV
jgi:hypothetical protein